MRGEPFCGCFSVCVCMLRTSMVTPILIAEEWIRRVLERVRVAVGRMDLNIRRDGEMNGEERALPREGQRSVVLETSTGAGEGERGCVCVRAGVYFGWWVCAAF